MHASPTARYFSLYKTFVTTKMILVAVPASVMAVQRQKLEQNKTKTVDLAAASGQCFRSLRVGARGRAIDVFPSSFFTPLPPSLTSRIVSADVKHHDYLLPPQYRNLHLLLV